MNKIKKYFLNLWYGLPFGMKAADTEIMGNNSKDNNSISIQQEVSDKRVGQHLLKGEITQEVEDLRYRTYRVANESKKYNYLGNGVAIKKENQTINKKKHRFTQDNENVCESILQTLKQVGNYGTEKYRFEIDYNSFVRFKIEKYATKVDVNINDEDGTIETTLHFNAEPNPYDSVSKPFINEISKLLNVKSEYEIQKNEIASSIQSLSFVTYKAINEDDLVTYCFVNGGKFTNFEKRGYEYLMTLVWDEYMRTPLNLETKYYSKSMAEKYERKEKKNEVLALSEMERKRYCSICGKEMSTYDADIQEASNQKIICKECMQKL